MAKKNNPTDFNIQDSKYRASAGEVPPEEDDFDRYLLAGNFGYALEGRKKRRSGAGIRLVWTAVLVLCLLGAAVMFLGEHEEFLQLLNPQAQTEPEQTQEATSPIPVVYDPAPCGFYGGKLDPEYRNVYNQLYWSILNYEAETANVILPTYQELDPILYAIRMDHADLFWFRGDYSSRYTPMGDHVDITITYEYAFPREQISQHIAFVEQQTQELLDRLRDKSEYEKAKGVYNFVIDEIIYDMAYKGTTIYDTLYNRRGVCEEYALLSKYLLEKLGIESIYVVGEAGTPGNLGSHAWNIVKVEGEYYQLDTTWGDPMNQNNRQTPNYNYFLVTDEEMGRGHFPERDDLPPCTATACNYYHRDSNYLMAFDYQTLYNWLLGAADRGIPLEFKCANRQVYDKVLNYLFQEEKIWDLMEDALGTIYSISEYYHHDETYVICIHIKW